MQIDVLSVMDAFSYVPNQVCCGNSVGGGMDDRGNGDSPQCCGNPVDTDMLKEARAAVAEMIAADEEFDAARAAFHHSTPATVAAAETRYDAAIKRREVALAKVSP